MTNLLPTKYVPLESSVVGQAGSLIALRQTNQTINELWQKARVQDPNFSFSEFTTSLTFLFIIGIVDSSNGLIIWSNE